MIGIDDWAYRRNHRYGTIVCDLERRRVVALLPDREQATAEAWLRQHPGISVVSRDRGGGYGEAVARALPDATQVADRWHLMENASAAFLDAVRLSMRAIRSTLGAATIDPALLTAAERLQHEGFLRREDTTPQILALKEAGHSIKEIVRRTRHSRKLVRQAVRGVRGDVFRVRQSSLEAYLPVLDAEWASGCRNGAELWRRLRSQGFRGSLRVVTEWATRRRRAELMQAQGLQKAPSARTLARLMSMGRDHLSKADTVTVAAVEAGVPDLADARSLVERFQAMIRTKAADRTGRLDRAGQGQPDRPAGPGRRQGCRCHTGCHHRTLVERPNRRPDHQAQADQASDVWPRQARPARSKAHRRRITADASAKLRQSPTSVLKSRPPGRETPAAPPARDASSSGETGFRSITVSTVVSSIRRSRTPASA